jgi:hypothetical protein
MAPLSFSSCAMSPPLSAFSVFSSGHRRVHQCRGSRRFALVRLFGGRPEEAEFGCTVQPNYGSRGASLRRGSRSIRVIAKEALSLPCLMAELDDIRKAKQGQAKPCEPCGPTTYVPHLAIARPLSKTNIKAKANQKQSESSTPESTLRILIS